MENGMYVYATMNVKQCSECHSAIVLKSHMELPERYQGKTYTNLAYSWGRRAIMARSSKLFVRCLWLENMDMPTCPICGNVLDGDMHTMNIDAFVHVNETDLKAQAFVIGES